MKRIVSRSVLGVCLAGAAAMPPWLEARGHARVAEAWAKCKDGRKDAGGVCGSLRTVDVDVDGLWIGEAWREVGPMRVQAQRVRVTAGAEGLRVHVRGLGIDRVAKTAAAVEGGGDQAAARPSPKRPRPIPSTHGIPVTIVLEDPVDVAGPAGAELSILQASVHLDGAGGLAIEGHVRAAHPALTVQPALSLHAEARGDLRTWDVSGQVDLGPNAPAFAVAGRTGEDGTEITVHGDGGAATLRPLGARALMVAADRFPLRGLAGLVDGAVLPRAVAIEEATISGTIEGHHGDRSRLHLREVVVDGIVLDDPRIAREPLALDAVRVDGDLGSHAGGAFAQLVLGREGAEIALGAALNREVVALEVELPSHDCQTLLDALPAAMRDALGGMRLDGQLQGHARLRIDRKALARARESYGGRPGETPPRPGELDFDLPVLESCSVTADPAAIDLQGLEGPYRHRFTTAGGEVRTRTLAPGAPGFAPLPTVRLVAEAFMTLEDRRFFSHDGFDREQMQNALWHNLVRGAVHRGASTISQQTTRNLWLGVDRSFARKLQEALLTARLEASVPKERILELYLNVIELGPGIHGVEAAAEHYFGKRAADLDVREAVHLAALAPAPSRYAARFASGEVDADWDEMLDRQVRRMHRAGHISAGQRDRALRARLRLRAH